MYLKKLNLSSSGEVAFVDKLSSEAFPASERRTVKATLDLYQYNWRYSIDLIVKNEEPIGFLTYWDLDEFVFAEHFAISPQARNGGIGGKVMALFMSKITKPIVLEVELPATILSERRIGFYQRLGYKLWDNIPYLQPPYQEGYNPIPMKLMTIGDIDLNEQFANVKDKIYHEVYNS